MKKRTIGIQAAVAVLLGVAAMSSYAGVATGLTRTIATQAIASNATAVATGSVSYSTAVPLPMGTVYIRVQLAGGAKFVGAAGTFINNTSLVVTNNGGSTHTLAAAGGVISADQSYVTFTDVITAAPSPVATVYTFQATAVGATFGGIANAAFLATPGAVLNATLSAGSSPTVFADIDTAAGGNIVTTVNGLAYTAVASSAAAFLAAPFAGGAVETVKINVATGTGTAFDVVSPTTAVAGRVNFGGFTFTNVAGALATDAFTAFDIATQYNTATSTAVATGNFGAALAAGGSVFLATTPNCAASVSTAVITAAGTVATFSAIPYYNTAVPVFVCMNLNTANATLIPETTPTLVVTRTNSAGASNVTTPSATLYALKNNGGTTLVRSYIPAAAAGYTSFLRLINTGSVSAPVSVAVIDDVTGVAGTAAVVSTVAAGGAVTLSSTQVEAAVGVIAAAKRPTLRVTAPSTVTTQSFILTNANGNFSNVSASE
nr:hypothetical protein [Rhodoferax sp.]